MKNSTLSTLICAKAVDVFSNKTVLALAVVKLIYVNNKHMYTYMYLLVDLYL